MNLQQIKQAISEGKKVYWSSLLYEVIYDDKNKDYLIKCTSSNGHSIGLTWTDGVTMNGKEEDFYILDKPTKDSWNREEARDLVRYALGRLTTGSDWNVDDVEEWLEKNV